MSTKSDIVPDHCPCSPSVLAASTACPSETALERPGLPSLIPDSLGPRRPRPLRSAMRLTERDRHINDLVLHARALTDDQVRVALFPPGAASRCQLRLTLLYRNHFLDRLPRKSVNEPAVYLLTRRSVNGNRLMRERWGEQEFRRHMTRLGSVGHLLAVNDIRVRVERACRDLGWELVEWRPPEELAPITRAEGVIPDAYFRVRRTVDGEPKTASFLLELERAAKRSVVLADKLKRYHDLYRYGRYEQLFGIRAMRLLVVFAAEAGSGPDRRIATGLDLARRADATFARFAELGHIKGARATDCLTAPLWRSPRHQGPVPLFDQGAPSRG